MKSRRSIWKSSRLNHFHLVSITSGPHSAILIYLFILPNERHELHPTFGVDTIKNLAAVWHKVERSSKLCLIFKVSLSGESAENIFMLCPIAPAFCLGFPRSTRHTLWPFDIVPL